MVMACAAWAAWAAVVLSPASTDPVPDWLLQPGAETKCWVASIAHHYTVLWIFRYTHHRLSIIGKTKKSLTLETKVHTRAGKM